MLRTNDLCAALHVHQSDVRAWRNAGMPHRRLGRGYAYDAGAVEHWLLTTGRAEPKHSAKVLNTVREVAERYGVDERTVRDWHHEPKFPGRAGWYPVEAMDLWVEMRPRLVNGRR